MHALPNHISCLRGKSVKLTIHRKTLRVLQPMMLAVGLSIGLLTTLVACQATQAEESPLPKLLAVVDLHNPKQMTGLTQSVLHPNGMLYVINSAEIGIISGTKLLHKISILLPSGAEPNALTQEYPTLFDLNVDTITGHVYVIDHSYNYVHVISGTEVITAFDSQGLSPRYVTFNPHSGFGYLSNNVKSREDGRSKPTLIISATKVITVLNRGRGLAPRSQVYNPVDGHIYIGHNHGDPERGEAVQGVLSIISGTEVLTTTDLGSANLQKIDQIVVNSQNGDMYMLDHSRLVYWNRTDPPRHLFINEGNRYGTVRALDIDTRTNFAYVTTWKTGENRVLLIDKDQIIAEMPVYDDPAAIAVDETHDYVYVLNRLVGAMSIIRGTEVITTISTQGWGPSYITLDEERGYIYVSNADSHSVAVFGFADSDTATSWRHFLPLIEK